MEVWNPDLITADGLNEAFNKLDHENGDGSRELDCRIFYAFGFDWIDENYYGSWRNHIDTHGYTAAWLSDHVFGVDGALERITNDLSSVYRLIHKVLPEADWIRVDCDPSGVGGYVGSWKLRGDQPTPYFEGKGVHGCEPMALLAALIHAYLDAMENYFPMIENKRRINKGCPASS